ncbi:MAG: Deoxyribose-phosphate aldolase 2 [bacterium ADurb.Bin243]|nr:MAG: Deoxyribose-phosphate aldolase 2 [bacterium ADurb.Bin243]
MDNKNLIELITREVLSTFNKPSAKPQTAPSLKQGGANVLVVLTGVSNMREVFYREIEKLSGAKYDILLSDGAKAVFDKNELASKTRAANIHTSFQYSDRSEFLNKYDAVVLAFMSLSALTHISSLNTDSMVCNYLVWHMISKKPLIVSAEPLLNQIGDTRPAIMREINQKIAKLSEFGVSVVPLAQICGALERACGEIYPYSALTGNSGGQAAQTACTAPAGCMSCGHCVVKRENAVNVIKDNGAARISSNPGVEALGGKFDARLAKMIDHTLLKPDAKQSDIDKLCSEASKYKFASVCVNPGWVKYCAEKLAGSGVMVCTVVGFPLGATSTSAKACETVQAIADGADEIDMVINIGALKSGNLQLVEEDIRQVVRAAGGKTVKVILETSLLTDDEKAAACRLSKNARAHFVKTSTGFGGGGATAADIALMRKTVGPEMGVKASGGVRDLKTAQEMIAAGATRVGASASVAIVSGAANDSKGY